MEATPATASFAYPFHHILYTILHAKRNSRKGLAGIFTGELLLSAQSGGGSVYIFRPIAYTGG